MTAAAMSAGMNAARQRFFLHDVLHAVGRRLQQAELAAHAIRAEPALNPRRDLAFGQREHRDADHINGEHYDHFDDRGDDERPPVQRRVRDDMDRGEY
jgi:hypothetical protein